MATWVARSIAPAPVPRPRARPLPDPKLPNRVNSLCNINVSRPISALGDQRLQRRGWRVGVVAPERPVPVEGLVEDHKPEERKDEKANEFDPGMPPPFGLAEIRAAIPKHCWVRDPWKSMGYVVRDVVAVLGLAFAAAYVNHWVVWPLYWAAQGTMFWALFVLGHDCGHGSFSTSHKLNSVVGHLLHSSILVPYHGWRISHRTHHQFHGHVEKDESWTPLTKKIYKTLDDTTRKLRFTPPFPLFAFPLYLFVRTPGKAGNHFDPDSDLFVPSERKDVLTSTACWLAMLALLAGLTWALGPTQMFKLYLMPYMVFVMWLDLVTYLHHHGHDDGHKLPWYRGKEWSYLRGGLSTLDHDYGWINNIHHDIGTHVIHHLFPQIPHYHLVEAVSTSSITSSALYLDVPSSNIKPCALLAASVIVVTCFIFQTRAARPVLGKYYIDPKKSGCLPFHLFGVLTRSLERDHYVSDAGDVVYYQTDPDQ